MAKLQIKYWMDYKLFKNLCLNSEYLFKSKDRNRWLCSWSSCGFLIHHSWLERWAPESAEGPPEGNQQDRAIILIKALQIPQGRLVIWEVGPKELIIISSFRSECYKCGVIWDCFWSFCNREVHVQRNDPDEQNGPCHRHQVVQGTKWPRGVEHNDWYSQRHLDKTTNPSTSDGATIVLDQQGLAKKFQPTSGLAAFSWQEMSKCGG